MTKRPLAVALFFALGTAGLSLSGCVFGGTDCAAIDCNSLLTIEITDLTDADEFDLRLDIDGEPYIAQCPANQACLLGNTGEADVTFERTETGVRIDIIGRPNEVEVEIDGDDGESAETLFPDWDPNQTCGNCDTVEIMTTYVDHLS